MFSLLAVVITALLVCSALIWRAAKALAPARGDVIRRRAKRSALPAGLAKGSSPQASADRPDQAGAPRALVSSQPH